MRRIVFNGESFCNSSITGIKRHSCEMLLELDKIVKPGEIILIIPKCGFDGSVFKNINVVSIGFLSQENKALGRFLAILWKLFVFPLYCFLYNAISVNTFLVWRVFNFDVISIYDCTAELFYAANKFNRWQALIKKQKRRTKKCRIILTDSYSAKKDIMDYYQVPADKIVVTYCGWQHFKGINEDKKIFKKLELEGKEFFFSLGSRMLHKNIKWIINAAKKNPDKNFVIAGYKGFEYSNNELEIPSNVLFSGCLKDEEIKALMMRCRAFIQPSLYEGFGIPPLEAMSVGADCMVSDIPVFREIYKDSVWYFDPLDYENIDLDEIMSRPKECNEKILDEFSWEKSARILWNTLQKLAN